MKLGVTPGPKSTSDILLALEHRLSPIDNFQCKVLGPIVTPGAANTAFNVAHNLGRIPINYIWNVDQNCVVYDNLRGTWTDQIISLKCSAAGAVLYLIVF